jgi:hypothetical protein
MSDRHWEHIVTTLSAGWESPGPGKNARASDEWLQEALNEYGAEGWQLVAMTELRSPDQPMVRCAFKREKRAEVQWDTASHSALGTAFWSDVTSLATDNAARAIGAIGVGGTCVEEGTRERGGALKPGSMYLVGDDGSETLVPANGPAGGYATYTIHNTFAITEPEDAERIAQEFMHRTNRRGPQ